MFCVFPPLLSERQSSLERIFITYMHRNKTLSYFSFVIALIMAAPGLVYGQSETAPTGLLRAQKPVPNRYIVVLKDPEQDANAPAMAAPILNVASTARELTGLYSGELGVTYENALYGFAVSMTEDRALALAKDPRVA